MGRAIVRDPQVFLFDEPLSNLDAKLRVQMRTEIKELHQRLKTTTVYVTHDQIEAMTMADKIVVMHDGIVEQMGAPLDLYDNPNNLFVAGFIGSPAMNMLKGTITAEGFATEGAVAGEKVVWPIGKHPADSNGKAAVYGIRPEHFRLDPNGLKAEVVVIEPTGSETQVVVRCGGHETDLRLPRAHRGQARRVYRHHARHHRDASLRCRHGQADKLSLAGRQDHRRQDHRRQESRYETWPPARKARRTQRETGQSGSRRPKRAAEPYPGRDNHELRS